MSNILYDNSKDFFVYESDSSLSNGFEIITRPYDLEYYKKEGNKYYFDCSYAQLEFYFFKFGKDVQIISPLNLRNRFSKKYHQALDNYRKQ